MRALKVIRRVSLIWSFNMKMLVPASYLENCESGGCSSCNFFFYERWWWDEGPWGCTEFLKIFLKWEERCGALLKGLCATDSCPRWRVWDVSCLERWQSFCHLPIKQLLRHKLTGICGCSRNWGGQFDNCKTISVWCSKGCISGKVDNTSIEQLWRNKNVLLHTTQQVP